MTGSKHSRKSICLDYFCDNVSIIFKNLKFIVSLLNKFNMFPKENLAFPINIYIYLSIQYYSPSLLFMEMTVLRLQLLLCSAELL